MEGTPLKNELCSKQTCSSLSFWASLILQPFHYCSFWGLSEVKVGSPTAEGASYHCCAAQPAHVCLSNKLQELCNPKRKLLLKVGHSQRVCHESVSPLCLAGFTHKIHVSDSEVLHFFLIKYTLSPPFFLCLYRVREGDDCVPAHTVPR